MNLCLRGVRVINRVSMRDCYENCVYVCACFCLYVGLLYVLVFA